MYKIDKKRTDCYGQQKKKKVLKCIVRRKTFKDDLTINSSTYKKKKRLNL